jgi:predicted dehydrogenase
MIDRRTFIAKSALACGSLPLFNILASGAGTGQKIRHASFGGGGMAFGDIKSLTAGGQVQLVAVADVDEGQLGKLREAFPDVKIYKDWRVLLEKEGKNLDSVNVSTPDHMHAPIGVTAMNLGLHVYGQKPLAYSIYECRRMAEIARQKKVVTQLGIQRAARAYDRLVVRMIADGVIGKVKEVHMFCHKTWGDPAPRPERTDPVPAGLEWDLWCGVAPETSYIAKHYHPKEWRKRLDFGTGTLGDMGCHIYSPVFQALGLRAPISVKSVGATPNQTNWAVDEKFEYVFPGTEKTADPTLNVTWYDGKLRVSQELQDAIEGKLVDTGSIFVGTDGLLLAGINQAPKLFPTEKFKGYIYPKVVAGDHHKEYVDAVRGEGTKPVADFADYGGMLTEAVLLGALASRFPGETLLWDAEKLEVKNHAAANGFLRREYRKGWEVEGLS